MLPHTFTAGGAIRANEMNANFAAVKATVDGKADKGTTGLRAGARLKPVVTVSPDGASAPFLVSTYNSVVPVFFDAQLGAACVPTSAGRCMPMGVAIVAWDDSACTVPVAQGLAGFTTGLYELGLDAGVFTPQYVYGDSLSFAGPAPQVFALGALRGPPSNIYCRRLSFLADGGTAQLCAPRPPGSSCDVDPGVPIYSVGAPVPLSTFAAVSVSTL